MKWNLAQAPPGSRPCTASTQTPAAWPSRSTHASTSSGESHSSRARAQSLISLNHATKIKTLLRKGVGKETDQKSSGLHNKCLAKMGFQTFGTTDGDSLCQTKHLLLTSITSNNYQQDINHKITILLSQANNFLQVCLTQNHNKV